MLRHHVFGRIKPEVKLKEAAGFASNPLLFTAEEYFHYDESKVIQSIANPCDNCQVLITRIGFDGSKFAKP